MTALQILLATAVATSPDSVRAPLPAEDIARVAYAAVQALPGVVLPAPWDSLATRDQVALESAVAGLAEGVEPEPISREERLFQAIARQLLQEGSD